MFTDVEEDPTTMSHITEGDILDFLRIVDENYGMQSRESLKSEKVIYEYVKGRLSQFEFLHSMYDIFEEYDEEFFLNVFAFFVQDEYLGSKEGKYWKDCKDFLSNYPTYLRR